MTILPGGTAVYTAVQTAGPVDTNAPTRGKFYAALTVLFPLIGALATFGLLSTDQASSITTFATAAMGLAGAFGFGVAAKNTNKQVKNGTFDAAPIDPNAPVLNVFEQLQAIQDGVNKTVATTVQQVGEAQSVIKSATALIPGPFGELAGGLASAGYGAINDLLASVGSVNRR
jgi:hypothetical protein